MAIPLRKYEQQVKISSETGAKQISGGIASEMIAAAGGTDAAVAKTFESLGDIGIKAYKEFQGRKDEAEITRINNEFLIDSAAYQNALDKTQTIEEAEALNKTFTEQQNKKSEGFNLSRKRKREAQLKFSNNLAQMEVLYSNQLTKIELDKQNTAYSQARVNALNNGIYDRDQFTSAKEAYDYYTDRMVDSGLISGATAAEQKSNFDINRQQIINQNLTTFDSNWRSATADIQQSWTEIKLKIEESTNPTEQQDLYDAWKKSVEKTLASDLSENEAERAMESLSGFLINADEFTQTSINNRKQSNLIVAIEKQIASYQENGGDEKEREELFTAIDSLEKIDPDKYTPLVIQRMKDQVVRNEEYKGFQLTLSVDIPEAKQKFSQSRRDGGYNFDEGQKQQAIVAIQLAEEKTFNEIYRSQNSLGNDLRIKANQGILTKAELDAAMETKVLRGIEYQGLNTSMYQSLNNALISQSNTEMNLPVYIEFQENLLEAGEILKNDKSIENPSFVKEVEEVFRELSKKEAGKDELVFSRNTILMGLEDIQKTLFTDTLTDRTLTTQDAYLFGVQAIISVYKEAIETSTIKNDFANVIQLRSVMDRWNDFIKENTDPENGILYPSGDAQKEWFDKNLGDFNQKIAVKKAMAMAYHISEGFPEASGLDPETATYTKPLISTFEEILAMGEEVEEEEEKETEVKESPEEAAKEAEEEEEVAEEEEEEEEDK